MRVIDLDQIDDEEERKKVLESYQNKMQDMQNERKSYLQQTGLDKIYSGDYSNSSDGFNTAGRNDFSVKPSIWDQIKTTASNMLGNTGYGLANGLIGFAQNEKRNQTAQKSLNMLSNISTLGTTSMLGNLGKSIQSTLDFAFKNNDKYNSLKKTYEDNKNNISNAIDEKLQKQEDINKENIQKNIIETTNPVGEKLVEIAPSLGQMLPSMIPGIGTLYSVGSANDSYYDEAKSRGMNDEQASNYSQLMGGVEGLTEQIGIGKLVKGGKGIAKGTVKEAFKDFGIGVADNFIQEAVIEPISEGVTKATAGDEYLKNDYRTSEGWKNLGKDMLQSGFDGAITAGIMGGVSAGLGKSINVYNKLKNGQQPTLEEYKSAYTEQRENGIDVDGIVQAEFKSRMNQSRQNDNKVTNTNNVNTQTNTQQDIANRLNEIVLNDKYLSQDDKQAMINTNNDLLENNQLDETNTLDAIDRIRKLSENANKNNESNNTITQLDELYNTIQSNNRTIDTSSMNLVDSAKAYNLNASDETIQSINQKLNDRGIASRFDGKLFTNADGTPNKNLNALWRTTTDENGNTHREIIFNPYVDGNINEQKTMQQVTIHEMLHDMAGDEKVKKDLFNLVLDKNKTRDGYSDARSNLEEMYSQVYDKNSEEFKSLIDEEEVADALAQKLGDQDFINSLNKEKPSVFKRIYNWIVDKLNKFTGSKNEKLYWEDVKNKFESAYRQDYQGTSNSNRFSIQTDSNGNKFVKIDTNQDIFKGKTLSEQTKIAKQYILDNFRDKGLKIDDKNVNVTSKTANEYTHPKNQLPYKTKQAKIKASTELDNMLNISDYQYSSNDDGRHRFAKDGWDYYKTVFEVDGVKFEGLVNIAKSGNKKTFYDVTNIKRISQNRSASDKSFSTSLTNSNNSIPTSNNNVNTTNNNSMQESENNSVEIQRRAIANKLKEKGAQVDNDGNVTLYHITTKENYDKINKDGYFKANDSPIGGMTGEEIGPRSFFSYDKDWVETWRQSNDSKIMEVKVPAEYIRQGAKNEKEIYIEGQLKRRDNGTWTTDKMPTSTFYDRKAVKEYLKKNSTAKPSIEQSGAWQSFLENQIGPSGKGKTVQELRLPTKENWDIVKNNNKNSKDLPDTKQFIVEKRTKKKLPIKEIKDELAQKIINKGHYIDKLAKKTGDKNLTYLYDRTLNSFNEAQISIGDNQVNSKGEVVGKSLNDIFKQAEEMELNVDFEDYLLNKHNIARTAFGKSIYGDTVSAPQSKRITENYEKQHPEFKEWAKEVNKYNDNNLKDLVDNGLVSKETYDKLKEMYGDYVPTYRDITETMQEFEDNRVGNNTLKSATKSNKNILSVKESMAEQTLAIKKAIRINNIGKELYKILGKDSKIMDGIEVDPTLMYTLDGEVVEKAKDGQNTFAIFDDGEITYFKISDDIYSAFSKDTLQNKINNSEVAKALLTPVEKLSQVQRNLLTTYSIGFAFNNPIKDFQDAVFNSKYSTGQFLKNYSKALYNIAKNGDWYKSYKNNGGTANTYFDYNKGLLPTKTKNPIKKFVNKIKDVNEILEQAPRLSEYISTIENNGSIDEALYNAAEITTNFKRGGDIAKVANKYGANFLNASIQGLDKFYRNLSGQNGWKGYARLLTKATLFQVVPSIVNGLLLKDDDDYSDLPEYTKDNYFLFKIGDGKFFRIPKGRVSSLIGGLSRRVLETAEGKEVNWKSLVDTTVNQMAPNNPFSDNVLAPIKQAIENKAWYGGEIVSSRLQKLPTAEQYDEKTDNLSKIIGKYTGISPKKINYVLDQYSGGIGDVLLPMMTPQAENNILEDKFTTDAILKNKNVSKYYEEVDNLEKNKNSENATDNDILKYKYMTEVSKDLSDLYSEKRNIENSNLSDKEKKVKVRKVQKEINNIVEERLDNVETINSNSKVAKIGDSQYYKYHGEWTKLSDDEKEKNKKISLKSYADFKNKVYNETEKQRKSGDLKENQQLKNTSKSEILLKSNYSNKEKLALYKNYVSSTDKKVEVAVEKLNMPIDVYLNYKTNQFENDKDKDGETISGTKKQKVYNYVNSLDNVDLIYKYMIVKMEGINDSDGDKAIINYVNKSQKFNFEERKEALKTLGFKVDKYGNVENMIFIPIKSKIK